MASKRNWFPTLNEALESEGLIEAWDSIAFRGIPYSSTFSWTWTDGTKHGHLISVTRDERGMYERPVHYSR